MKRNEKRFCSTRSELAFEVVLHHYLLITPIVVVIAAVVFSLLFPPDIVFSLVIH